MKNRNLIKIISCSTLLGIFSISFASPHVETCTCKQGGWSCTQTQTLDTPPPPFPPHPINNYAKCSSPTTVVGNFMEKNWTIEVTEGQCIGNEFKTKFDSIHDGVYDIRQEGDNVVITLSYPPHEKLPIHYNLSCSG